MPGKKRGEQTPEPTRSAQQAIRKVKEYAEQGYTHAVEVDLSKYFDTLNHELLMNLLRKHIHDKRVLELIIRGWLNHYYVADMKRILQGWNEWLRRRFRMYLPMGEYSLGLLADRRCPILSCFITNEKLALAGYFDFPAQYEQLRKLHLCD